MIARTIREIAEESVNFIPGRYGDRLRIGQVTLLVQYEDKSVEISLRRELERLLEEARHAER